MGKFLCIFFLVQVCSLREFRILQDYLFYAQGFSTETLRAGVDRWLMSERLHNPKFLFTSREMSSYVLTCIFFPMLPIELIVKSTNCVGVIDVFLIPLMSWVIFIFCFYYKNVSQCWLTVMNINSSSLHFHHGYYIATIPSLTPFKIKITNSTCKICVHWYLDLGENLKRW